jgi:hypothetical protein
MIPAQYRINKVEKKENGFGSDSFAAVWLVIPIKSIFSKVFREYKFRTLSVLCGIIDLPIFLVRFEAGSNGITREIITDIKR